jgi:hypothetical protein
MTIKADILAVGYAKQLRTYCKKYESAFGKGCVFTTDDCWQCKLLGYPVEWRMPRVKE